MTTKKILALLISGVFATTMASQGACMITWNTQGVSTDVANGILSLDELTTSTSHTYVNVCGDGYDIRVSGSALMVASTGDLNYTAPNSSINFEFFQTGTTNPVVLDGFAIDWLDLDSTETMGVFTAVDAAGTAITLDTSSSYFILGASVGTTDLDGANGVNPDGINSTANGGYNNFDISFITDFSGLPIRSFSIDNTSGYIAPTSLTITDPIVIVSSPVPEPSSTALLGLGGFAFALRRRRS